jgi:hypothetical protein
MSAMRTFIVLLAISLPMLVSADENFRCGKWIASSGMTLPELLEKCGEPATRTSSTEDVMVRNKNTGLMTRIGDTLVEVWTYDRGTTAPAMVVTIVDGKIKSIDRKK